MRRLTENLRRDGALSSAPLIYGDRIISGHHRVEAAMKAGIVEADCLSIGHPAISQFLSPNPPKV